MESGQDIGASWHGNFSVERHDLGQRTDPECVRINILWHTCQQLEQFLAFVIIRTVLQQAEQNDAEDNSISLILSVPNEDNIQQVMQPPAGNMNLRGTIRID